MKPDTTRLPLRERNKQRVTQRIMDVAFALFRSNGYEQTTMEMIAEQAEVSRGTLFNYFPSKQALLLPFANDLYVQHVQPQILSYLETRPSILETFRFTFMSIHEHILTYPDITKALQWELLHPQTYVDRINLGAGFIGTLITIIQSGQQWGEIRTDLSAKTLALYVGSLYITLVQATIQQASETAYAVEIESLLAFLRSAFQA